MKKEIILIILVGQYILSTFAQHPPQDKNWEVIFQDDFSTLDKNRWNIVHDFTHGEEPQVYIRDNVYIENGKIVIRTLRQNYPCPTPAVCLYGGMHEYTSGQFETRNKYKYGYHEIYAKLPTGQGYWPAFWFYGEGANLITNDCWYNEIDIFEICGCKSGSFSTGIHAGFTCGVSWYGAKVRGKEHECNYANSYHWYGIEWNSDRIIWYLDRKIIRQDTNNLDTKGIQNFLPWIINVALQKDNSDECSDCLPNNNTLFPGYMYIDQANVYQLKYDCNTIVNEILNYNAFNYGVKKSISLSGVSSLTAGENVSLRATDFIELKAGFEVPVGAELYLDINPCE